MKYNNVIPEKEIEYLLRVKNLIKSDKELKQLHLSFRSAKTEDDRHAFGAMYNERLRVLHPKNTFVFPEV